MNMTLWNSYRISQSKLKAQKTYNVICLMFVPWTQKSQDWIGQHQLFAFQELWSCHA